MKRRIPACALLALMLAALLASTALALPAAIGPEDFVVRIGKTDFDLLTHDIDVAILSSGKKLKKTTQYGEGEEFIEYVLKAKEATFYLPESLDYTDRVALTKKGVTARGIKIGSTQKELLAAYPPPNDVWDEGKVKTCIYRVEDAPAMMPDSVSDQLGTVRPDYFYELYISVSNKTNKVTKIIISAQVG